MGKSKPLSQSVLVGPWDLVLPPKRLFVDGLRCEWGPGRVLFLDSFLWIWDGKKHVILTAFFLPFSMKWILATANPQPTSVCVFSVEMEGLRCASFDPLVTLFLMKLWSAGCTVKFSLPLSLPCAATCVCVHARTHTHPYHPTKHRI